MKIITATINFFVLMTVCLTACQQAAHEGQMFVKAVPFKTSEGWGYEIYADNKLYIRQAFIPGVPGRHSFASREDARRVGDLVLQKMAVLHTLPSVSQSDLAQLHIQMPDRLNFYSKEGK